jgi:hypothetical protein
VRKDDVSGIREMLIELQPGAATPQHARQRRLAHLGRSSRRSRSFWNVGRPSSSQQTDQPETVVLDLVYPVRAARRVLGG